MGRPQSGTTHRGEMAAFADESQRVRFAEYFPKVFAYVQSRTRDESRSREIVVEAFARVFNRESQLPEEDFPIVLFSVTRDLCSGGRSIGGGDRRGLNDREREVISLLFDAHLTRGQVSDLLRMPDENVVSHLVSGLRKLKAAVTNGSRPSLQQL